MALTTFSDLIDEAREEVRKDAVTADLTDNGVSLQVGGSGAVAYADAISIYLSCALSRLADRGSAICSWDHSVKMEGLRNTFSRQAIPMVWDYAEGNPLSYSSGNISNNVSWIAKAVEMAPVGAKGTAQLHSAFERCIDDTPVLSTDPPYYDNIGYADLSDYFYVWLRRALRSVLPELFATLTVPKSEELVATPHRHESSAMAEAFFLTGMTQVMNRLCNETHPAFPVTIYYAFKQSEAKEGGATASTGWETFLDAVMRAGFCVTGTWPIRTELGNRMVGRGTNALATSIVLVCRPWPADASTATRRELQTALRTEFPAAVAELQQANIAPVDLAQASIGPAMAVFSRYREVLNADGSTMTMLEALALINATLDEVLAEQEGDFDADTRWAVTWFEQYGYDEADFGLAEQLSKAKNTSVDGLVASGAVISSRGRARLLRPTELPREWDPATDPRRIVWETAQHLIRALETGGEPAAAALASRLGAEAETARDVAYRLYLVSERHGRAADARMYNGLVQSWPEITRLAQQTQRSQRRRARCSRLLRPMTPPDQHVERPLPAEDASLERQPTRMAGKQVPNRLPDPPLGLQRYRRGRTPLVIRVEALPVLSFEPGA
ncbi:DUF1156 domain-containing protein [Candidatus Poriferisodalis sp.]|uniref:DUF1156 domain-containing protein n=1 Tax=Candidatus Poriferisodalis sp. TaxID=3101277 RepID=UPI003B0166FA